MGCAEAPRDGRLAVRTITVELTIPEVRALARTVDLWAGLLDTAIGGYAAPPRDKVRPLESGAMKLATALVIQQAEA